MTPLGKMILVCIEDLVQEIGFYGSLWSLDMDKCATYVSTYSWIYHTCKYICDHNIKIHVAHAQLTPRRSNDKAIMELALEYYEDVSTSRSINRVRMLQNIYHLSDITCNDGRSLSKLFTKSIESTARRNANIWPIKHKVYTTDFTRWRKILKLTFTSGSMKLPFSLQHWNSSIHMNHNNWDWCIQPDKTFLYHYTDLVWRRNLRQPGTHQLYFKASLQISRPPANLMPASVDETRRAFRVQSYAPQPPPKPPDFNIHHQAIHLSGCRSAVLLP